MQRARTNTHGHYFDLDFLLVFGLRLLCDFTAGAAERGSCFWASFLPLALGFLATTEEDTFVEVGFLVVRVLPLDDAFFKDFNVPLIPA